MIIQLRLKNSGFTIIEILVMVIIILMLAAVIWPHFLDVENQAQRLKVVQNMKTVQKAAEDYAKKSDGYYPIKSEDIVFKSFFPDGNADNKNPQNGTYPENPFTHLKEAPLDGNITNIEKLQSIETIDLGGARVSGKIFYNPLILSDSDKAIGYIILGADQNGRALSLEKSGHALTLSNTRQIDNTDTNKPSPPDKTTSTPEKPISNTHNELPATTDKLPPTGEKPVDRDGKNSTANNKLP
jgi:type II secretory pathway pseudopilin PulG